jgi:hypothetical protein
MESECLIYNKEDKCRYSEKRKCRALFHNPPFLVSLLRGLPRRYNLQLAFANYQNIRHKKGKTLFLGYFIRLEDNIEADPRMGWGDVD